MAGTHKGNQSASQRGRVIVTPRLLVGGLGHPHRFSHIVRGGVVVGLLLLGTGSVLCSFFGVPFTAALQTAIGTVGVLSGAILGAREPE